MHSDKSQELQTAIEAAKAGAQQALRFFNKHPKVTLKPDNSPVTEADKTSEEVIKQTILATFPNAKFLGEESGGSSNEEKLWVIDPIDGTRNFIRGLPFWGILIAFVVNGKPTIGVSYTPAFDELLYAEQGFGAYCNEKKITVSNIEKLENASVTHGSLQYFNSVDRVLPLFMAAFHESGYGDCFGYNLVAQGREDCMLDGKVGPWDAAAIKIIIEEAGGKVTNLDGKDWQLTDTTCLATNELIHDEVLDIVNNKK